MSLESDVGRVTRDVMGAVSDAVCSNLVTVLKNEMKLSNDQIAKITSIVNSTIEDSGFNGINQYVSLIKASQNESAPTKKGKLFG
jgi:uncharacterized protein (UPF0297 family)